MEKCDIEDKDCEECSTTQRIFDWSRMKLKNGDQEQKHRARDEDVDEQENAVESEYDW